MSEDRILKAKDLKKMFGCSDYKLYKILSQPDFPAVKIGRDYYVKESDFDKWFDTYKGQEYNLI